MVLYVAYWMCAGIAVKGGLFMYPGFIPGVSVPCHSLISSQIGCPILPMAGVIKLCYLFINLYINMVY